MTAEGPKDLGIITSTMLGVEDHGVFSFWIMFDFGGISQGFGGWCLDEPRFKDEEEREFIGRFGTASGCDAIMKILDAVGVQKWEDLKGKECWCFKDRVGFGGIITGIQAPDYRPHKGRFDLKAHFKETK